MHLILGALALIQFQQATVQPPKISVADSTSIVSRARARAELFDDRDALKRRAPSPRTPAMAMRDGCPTAMRLMYDPKIGPDSAQFRVIRNFTDNRYSFCPLWILPQVRNIADQRLSIDNELAAQLRPSVRVLRKPVLDYLDSLAKILPGDEWLLGQRVRLYVDQGDSVRAARAARQCGPAPWWCAALAGYVDHVFRNEVAAEAHFNDALATMREDLRCEWEDLSSLFDNGARRRYAGLSCPQRDALNANVWWLGDPLYLEPANERRNEHFARLVQSDIRLNDGEGAIDYQAGYSATQAHWRERAVNEMVIRFGWPTSRVATASPVSFTTDMNPGPQMDHTPGWRIPGTGEGFDTRRALKRPQTTFPSLSSGGFKTSAAYRWPQIHTIPPLSGAMHPLDMTDRDWRGFVPARFVDGAWDTTGWAPEFYRRDAGPIELLETQVAFLRRQHTAFAMVGVEWSEAVHGLPPNGKYRFGVMLSGKPSDKLTGPQTELTGTGAHGIILPIESRRLLMGVEMISLGADGTAGRTRFGVSPPFPLDSMAVDSIALSDPVLLRATLDTTPARTISEATRRIIGSLALENPAGLGVFWELYGSRMNDTISFSVRLIRHDDGFMTRILSVFGARQRRDTITVNWSEAIRDTPEPGTDVGVSARGRGLNMNVSALLKGEYTVEIIASRRATPVAVSRREFWIIR